MECDMCGASCAINDDDAEYAVFNAKWGYFSQHDLEEWECYFCEQCAEKIIHIVEKSGGKVKRYITSLWGERLSVLDV